MTFTKIINSKLPITDRVIDYHPDYEYGYENYGGYHYIKFYDLLMIDLDGMDLNLDRFDDSDELWAIYKTPRGYHVFLLSREVSHKSLDAILIQERYGCDQWYVACSYNYGYKIRAGKKPTHPNDAYIAKFTKYAGRGKEESHLKSLLDIHDKYMNNHIDSLDPI